MRLWSSALALLSIAGFNWCSGQNPCSDEGASGTYRDQMLARFRHHFADKDKGYFTKPRKKPLGNMTIMMSKEDFYCGGGPSPNYYIQFIVEGARPVDVFNVLSDSTSQPHWLCNGCTIKLIKNDLEEKVQGYIGAYRAAPVNRREFYQWQAYDADFDTEEFLLGVTARHNKELHELRDPEKDATVGRMCLAFSWIRKHPLGAFVVQQSHFNVRVPFSVGPFSPRNMYHLIWPLMLQRVPRIIKQSKEQNKKGWDKRRLTIPLVFVGKSGPQMRGGALEQVANSTHTAGALSNHRWLPFVLAALGLVICCALIFFCVAMGRKVLDGGYCEVFNRCDEEDENEEEEDAETASVCEE